MRQSKEMSEESIKAPSTTDTSLYPEIITHRQSHIIRKRVKFKEICLRQESVSFI